MNSYLRLGSVLFNNGVINTTASNVRAVLAIQTNSLFTFQIADKNIKNTRVTRPKVSKDRSIPLTYEQTQFVEKIGVTKSWNSWNTSNLLEGTRTAETTFDDIFIRKFIYATFHDTVGSEIIVKRRFNQISIGFLIARRKKLYSRQLYFLVGYSEELLSALLKCTVKIDFQTVEKRGDLIFRHCFSHLSLLKSSLLCLFMSFLYVISLYLWSHENRFRRQSPDVIKRRFVSVLSTSAISLCVVYLVAQVDTTVTGYAFNKWIGLRVDATTVFSTLFPLVLTMVLFAGPILQACILNPPTTFTPTLSLPDIYWWRDYIFSPLTEEFVFRACMIPLLIPSLGLKLTVYLTPLIFSIAHLHHIVESIYYSSDTKKLKMIIFERLFQLFYTYLFGLYSAFIFIRCANIIPCVLCHSFCNYMSFPNVGEVLHSKSLSFQQRVCIVGAYLAGVVAFVLLITPITNPSLFDNKIFVNY